MIVLQGKVHQTLIGVDSFRQDGLPPQLQTLQTALDFTAEERAAVSLADISTLLAQTCHPDLSQRISAPAVADIPWLREAAAKPLADCPAII